MSANITKDSTLEWFNFLTKYYTVEVVLAQDPTSNSCYESILITGSREAPMFTPGKNHEWRQMGFGKWWRIRKPAASKTPSTKKFSDRMFTARMTASGKAPKKQRAGGSVRGGVAVAADVAVAAAGVSIGDIGEDAGENIDEAVAHVDHPVEEGSVSVDDKENGVESSEIDNTATEGVAGLKDDGGF